MMHSPQDLERFSLWLASLSNRRPHERLDLLRLRATRENTAWTNISHSRRAGLSSAMRKRQ
ncbi:unnamed protein product [Prunus armeniaca]